jgi:isoleucyl-tRNA synthetase
MTAPADYKSTLLLPKTDFPMRAELPKREPAQLARWTQEKIYARMLEARREAAQKRETTFVLHDGPPFANGDAHMGHALNMVLKDLVLKSRTMAGNYTPFVPGWDCHGLPIEHKVMKELGAAESDPLKIRAECEKTARHFVGVQRTQFQRLGIFGDWENPYVTMDPAYEAETLRVFATLVGRNLVYQGLRPVHWSTGCQTALAEAEIEYQERVDPAIFVKFALTEDAATRFPELEGASLLIWTTTPWTLPANLAVAVAPELDYAVYEVGGEKLLLHTKLVSQLRKSAGADPSTAPAGSSVDSASLAQDDVLPATAAPLGKAQDDEARGLKMVGGPWKGSDLEGLTYTHPFLDDGKRRQIYAADFVTADAGTGLVHIAPGHGQDDYQLGQQHGLPAFAPVDDRGCLTAEAGVPELTGVYVFKANAPIIELLKARGALFAQEEYRHDYPHCWRSKTPIVFRAVKQWFIRIDGFRSDALAAIDGVSFYPESGRNRIRGAVKSRPDWCISRQRTWGIPLPVFYGPEEEPILNEKTVRAFADLVEKEGGGIWFAQPADELAARLGLPAGLRKGRDTLDVWIDSGTSWAAVAQKRAGLAFPADLYLEGSDQHRGWFQSSLLTAVAAAGQAPYRSVLTNGFVVDLEGKKLSKSGTGYQKPVDLMTLVNQHGADVLRLWVASQDYQDDIPFSTDIFARVADAYRSIRNTLRILLGNVGDFDPAKDAVPREKWTELDRYVHDVYAQLNHVVQACYARYDFPQVYQAINRFCAVELSALYVDVLKDRLYCNAKNDPARRAAQTVLHLVLEGLAKWLAPILAFTAEEAWQFLGRGGSVHTELFPPVADAPDNAFLARWKNLLELRARVNEKLEAARRDKVIGKSLEARVEIATPIAELRDGSLSPALLEELFIVSQVVVTAAPEGEAITVTRADQHGLKKCVRCWKYWDEVGSNPSHPELCARCTGVVLNFGD